MRPLLGLVAGAVVSWLGALVVGEYVLTGVGAVLAAGLFGLIVGEAVAVVSRQRRLWLAVAAGLITAGGLLWTAWIASGEEWDFVSTGAWIGVPVGGVVTLLWVRGSGRRVAGTRSEP